MWSWIPPKAIIRRVWSVICRASAPSEEARFTDQYDIRNIRLTGTQKQCQFACQHSSEKCHSWMIRLAQTHYNIWILKPGSSTAALGIRVYSLSDLFSVCLPGVGNLGASLNPPYSSSYEWASCWKHLWATSRAGGRVSSEWAQMAVDFCRASITRSPLDSSASLLICHWNKYEHRGEVGDFLQTSNILLLFVMHIWHGATCLLCCDSWCRLSKNNQRFADISSAPHT